MVDKNTEILIVDDNPQYAKVLERILRGSFGYTNIVHVDNTSDAYSLIQGRPDTLSMLFIDYNFPIGDNGGVLLEKLQAGDLLKTKVAFLMTADPTVDNVAQARAAGAIGVVAKPFNSEELKNQLKNAQKVLFMNEKESF